MNALDTERAVTRAADLDVDTVIAQALRISVEEVTEDLQYQSIASWDSLGHVTLMLVLERALDTRIDDDLLLSLRSVTAIRRFVEDLSAPAEVTDTQEPAAIDGPKICRGLDGVYIDRTAIARIDGRHGTLEYRGYDIAGLVQKASFEEVVMLLLKGEWPAADTTGGLAADLESYKALPPEVLGVLRSLSGAPPMDALRTAVSTLGAIRESPSTDVVAALRLVADVSLIIGAHHSLRAGRRVQPPSGSSFAERLLSSVLDQRPEPDAIRFANCALVLHAEHGANASTFAARIAIGTDADLFAAVTAAIAVFSGSRHGGATEEVANLLDELATPEEAVAYVKKRLASREPVIGFGHRVYRVSDPRVSLLRGEVERLAGPRGQLHRLHVVDALVEAMAPYASKGVHPNVDLYTALGYRLLGVPVDLCVPMFVAGRIAGWTAHALEQRHNNVLIRPLLYYVGPSGKVVP
jgi:citrate synthase